MCREVHPKGVTPVELILCNLRYLKGGKRKSCEMEVDGEVRWERGLKREESGRSGSG